MLLSGLVSAEESQLDDFRRKRLGRTGADLDDLRRLREVLLRLGDALQVGDTEASRLVRVAHAAVVGASPPLDTGSRHADPVPSLGPVGSAAPAPDVLVVPPPVELPFVAPPPLVVEDPLDFDEHGPATPPLLEASLEVLAPAELAPALPFTHTLPPPPPQDPLDDGATAEIGLLFDAVLPFTSDPAQAGSRSGTEPPASESSDVEPLSQSLDTPVPPATELAERIGAEPLPFRRSQQPVVLAEEVPLPDLTLEAYASMRALAAAFPERRWDTLRRYGIVDQTVADRLDARWEVRFVAEPELAASYLELFQHYRAWFESNG